MKSISKFIGAVAAGFFALCGTAMADPCGGAGLPACVVPEPGSLPLVLLAVAGAVVVARIFRK